MFATYDSAETTFLQDVFYNLILGLYIINTFIIYSLSTTNVFDIDIPCIKTHFF